MNPVPPVILWRISKHRDLDGIGGEYGSARWHTMGRRIVYLAESPSGSLLEVLVHLELPESKPPTDYQLLKLEASLQETVDLAPDWDLRSVPDKAVTRDMGDRWLASGSTALARVPSAIVPETFNWLLNPRHPDARMINVAKAILAPYDPRLFQTPPFAPS